MVDLQDLSTTQRSPSIWFADRRESNCQIAQLQGHISIIPSQLCRRDLKKQREILKSECFCEYLLQQCSNLAYGHSKVFLLLNHCKNNLVKR